MFAAFRFLFGFHKIDISDRDSMAGLFALYKPARVIYFTPKAGVRYYLTNPHVYIDANLQGSKNILESCRYHQIIHLVYVSLSSVNGGNVAIPFSEHDNLGYPLSLCSTTKKSQQADGEIYSHFMARRQLEWSGRYGHVSFRQCEGEWGSNRCIPLNVRD